MIAVGCPGAEAEVFAGAEVVLLERGVSAIRRRDDATGLSPLASL